MWNTWVCLWANPVWYYHVNTRCSRHEVFCKKGVFKNFIKFTGKHQCQSLFFNKVTGTFFYRTTLVAPSVMQLVFSMFFICNFDYSEPSQISMMKLCVKAVNYFRKNHDLRCLTQFQIRLWTAFYENPSKVLTRLAQVWTGNENLTGGLPTDSLQILSKVPWNYSIFNCLSMFPKELLV